MSTLFSDDWMKGYQAAWNNEPDLAGALEKINFNSAIGYGYQGEDQPRGYILVENGQVVEAGEYSGQELSWDLRAADALWSKWLKKPPGMLALGAAYTTGKLKFEIGDYAAMVKDPRMAGPFIKSFSAMASVT